MPTHDEKNKSLESRANRIPPQIDAREYRLFRSLDVHNEDQVFVTDVLDAISRAGLSRDDVRLRETMKGLEPYSPRDQLSCQKFCELVRPNILLVEQALPGQRGHP